MGSIFTPVNQVRLTNVAIVRLKRTGKRFEIACYKNKVISWREKAETDIDEVLQTHDIFLNVSKGLLAKKQDLEKCFGDIIKDVPEREKNTAVCKFILAKGQLQVAEKERQHASEATFLEIANIVSQMAINLETKRAFSTGVIERAMKEELHYSIRPNDSAKKQALAVMKELTEKVKSLQIGRANMRLNIVASPKEIKSLLETLNKQSLIAEQDSVNYSSGQAVVCIQPGHFKTIDEIVSKNTRGKGRVEVLAIKDVNEEEEDL